MAFAGYQAMNHALLQKNREMSLFNEMARSDSDLEIGLFNKRKALEIYVNRTLGNRN